MKRILLDYSLSGLKTALQYDKELVEIIIDNYDNASIVGNIYIGKVERVIPNQFAFINIGEDKSCFLQVEDSKQREVETKIRQGDQVVVQISKDSQEEKGAYATTEISVNGKYVVLMKGKANEASVSISQKIGNEKMRKLLKETIGMFLPKGYNVIIRTKGEEATEEEIKSEIIILHEKLSSLLEKSNYIKAPFLLYGESITKSSLKILLSSEKDIDEIITNDSENLEEIIEIAKEFSVKKLPQVKVYNDEIDMFDYYEIESQIEKALNEKVWLKSGGFLIIEETKTCVVIDVNTGKFVSKKNKQKLILQNNFEAAKEIAKQIKLRNLSGVIIIDFVDLYQSKDKEELLGYFQKELKKDRIIATIVDYSTLNIVQLTRKKTRMSLSFMLTDKCPMCVGEGKVPKIEFVCDNIYKKVKKLLVQTIFNKITISSNKRIINYLEKSGKFIELAENYNAEITLHTINTGKFEYFEIEKERKGE